MTTSLRLTVGLLLFYIMLSCATKERENVIIVSVEPQRALLEEIVGDKFRVESVLTPGANPETFEPGMQMRRDMETASAYMTTGFLPFEQKLIDVVGKDMKIVDTSKGIEPVYGTHGHSHHNQDSHHSHDHNHSHCHGHTHGDIEADPHTWTSVRNARQIAKNMYEALLELDSNNGEYYSQRYMNLINRLDSLDNEFGKKLQNDSVTRTFAIWHPSLSYLARDYGLEQLSVGFENKEMAAGALHDIIVKAKEKGVKVFFFQKEYDTRQAETLNKEMGTTLININPLDYDWEEQIERIVSALCQ